MDNSEIEKQKKKEIKRIAIEANGKIKTALFNSKITPLTGENVRAVIKQMKKHYVVFNKDQTM
ncbi:MAG: hypothetical protein A2015_02210 [Spirochaetes bacterium GWF1_31_7]|nr:MAG: hypothetical protein A2Y30_06060 [Spirochaetes bacterium GWE1_32_154]OHD50729.1 MAG: hypothetical protein A2015_02210 [Spirochaetes bacterium GWF1_31_7]HBD95066.1 hypothetical protein [Spirochaetia bacterium]HBI38048.1 hypothetical protein [Spirochaetia bacterium]